MSLRIVGSALVFLLLVVASMSAQVLYDDGPINGTVNAWTINFGFVVSDTITLAQRGTVGGMDFGVWEFAGDQVLTIDWSITSDIDGGTTYGKGTASVTDTFISVNQYGYDIDELNAMFSGPTLDAGTYWLNLENAVTKQGNPLYWDENSGVGCKGNDGMGGGCPSEACEAPCIDAPFMPPESFDILGTSGSQVPEPGSFILLGSGVLGVVGWLRRK